MGNACCKSSPDGAGKRVTAIRRNSDDRDEDDVDIDEYSEPDNLDSSLDDQDHDEINVLRAWLQNDLALFVINNALMSVQFFQNFEEETELLRQELRKSEATDVPGHRFKFYKADRMMEIVGTHVVFRPKHGPFSNTEGLLHPLRSFILYQNVQIQWDKDPQPQRSQERPFYVLRTEEVANDSLRDAGFLSLKEVESKQPEAIYESIDPICSPRNSPPPEKRPSTGLLEVPQEAEPEYTYTTIRRLLMPELAGNFRSGFTPTSSCVIPPDTFTEVEVKVLNPKRRTGAAKTTVHINYLDSKKFMKQFVDVLIDCLSEPLNLGQELDYAWVQGNRVIIQQGLATHYIMPAIPGKFWPDPALRFALRESANEDAWPTHNMRRRISDMGMQVIPLGYLQRRGSNPDFKLQWRYACPQAEQYTLLHTMHAHVRCYLFAVTIFKTYLEDTFLGVDHTHLQHILFREIERDALGWPEDRPAENLLNFLAVVSKCIEARTVRNFFIHSRNMIESSPYLFLNKVQGKLTEILDNPLPYILLALKNLRMRSSFYPELDFTHLYKLATTKNVIPVIYPYLRQPTRKNPTTEENSDEEAEDQDLERQWLENRAQELRKKKQMEEKRPSVETINLATSAVEKEDDFKRERRQAILTIFIEHFLAMAKTSKEFRATAQALIYLQQAKRLTVLLRDEQDDASRINDYSKTIMEELQNCQQNSGLNTSNSSINKDNSTGGIRLSLHSRPLPEPPTP